MLLLDAAPCRTQEEQHLHTQRQRSDFTEPGQNTGPQHHQTQDWLAHVKAESVSGDRLSSVNGALTFAPPAQSSVLPQNSAHGVPVVGRHQRSLGSEALLVVPHQGAMADLRTWRQRHALAFTSTDALSCSPG